MPFFAGLAHQGKMEHLNGYGLISTRNRIYSSDLNTLVTWPTIGFIDRQAQQDIGSGLAKLGRQIISFGTSTMEIYQPVGSATGSPLGYTGSAFDFGLASTIVTGQRHYTAVVDGKALLGRRKPKRGLHVQWSGCREGFDSSHRQDHRRTRLLLC
jgi:hypothetical protein